MGNATWFCTLGIFGTARHHLENILPNPNFLIILELNLQIGLWKLDELPTTRLLQIEDFSNFVESKTNELFRKTFKKSL